MNIEPKSRMDQTLYGNMKKYYKI